MSVRLEMGLMLLSMVWVCQVTGRRFTKGCIPTWNVVPVVQDGRGCSWSAEYSLARPVVTPANAQVVKP